MEIIIIGLLFLIAVVSYLVVFGDKKKEGRKGVRLKYKKEKITLICAIVLSLLDAHYKTTKDVIIVDVTMSIIYAIALCLICLYPKLFYSKAFQMGIIIFPLIPFMLCIFVFFGYSITY